MKKFVLWGMMGIFLLAGSAFANSDAVATTTVEKHPVLVTTAVKPLEQISTKRGENKKELSGSLISSGVFSAQVIACIKQASITREVSIQGSFKKFSEAVQGAYVVRGSDVTLAFSAKTTMKEIREEIRKAFATWRSAVKAARDTLRQERKGAWETYRTAVKACKPNASGEAEVAQDAASQEKLEGLVF